MNRANVELAYVVAMMLLLFLFGAGAVVVFWRVWRKEQRDKREAGRDGARPNGES